MLDSLCICDYQNVDYHVKMEEHQMQPVQRVSAYLALMDPLAKMTSMNAHQTLVKMEEIVQMVLILLYVCVNLVSLD